MAAGGDERIILIAMDGSEYSDYAFNCKLLLMKLIDSLANTFRMD